MDPTLPLHFILTSKNSQTVTALNCFQVSNCFAGTTVAIQLSYIAVQGVSGGGFSKVLSNRTRARCEVLQGLFFGLMRPTVWSWTDIAMCGPPAKCGVKCKRIGLYVQCEVLYFYSSVFCSEWGPGL